MPISTVAVLHGNPTVKVAMDGVDFTKIAYLGWRPVGTGPGGAMVSPRTVANTSKVVSFMHHHKFAEIVVGFDEDVLATLIAAGKISMTADNAVFTTFIITQKNNEAQTRTVTFQNVYVQLSSDKYEDAAEHQITEVTFVGFDTITIGAWA